MPKRKAVEPDDSVDAATISAWGAYKRNFFSFAAAVLLMVAIPGILMFLGILPFIMMLVGVVAGGATVPEAVSMMFSQGSSLMFSFLFMLALLVVAIAVSVLLRGGLTAMAVEALTPEKKGFRKVSFRTMFSVGFARWKTFVGVTLIVFFMTLLVFLVFAAPGLYLVSTGVSAGWVLFAIGVLLFLPVALVLEVLFAFVYLTVVMDRLHAVRAVKASIRFGRANFWDVLALLVIFGAVAFVAGLLNSSFYFVGTLLAVFVVVPLQTLSFAALYLGRKKSKR